MRQSTAPRDLLIQLMKGVQVFKKTSNWSLAGLLLLTIVLSACGNQPATTQACGAGSLQAAANLTPNNVVVDASKPVTLSWTHEDNNCVPTYYEVVLGIAHDGSVPGTTQASQTTSLNWPEVLKPGNTYFWTVYPVLVTNGQAERGPGQLGYFYTGPVCAAGEPLQAPQLITPPNNTPLDPSTTIVLRWDDPTLCLPDGSYSVQVAKTADFSSALYASQTGKITELSLPAGWTTDVVTDCTRYYWRVRAEPDGATPGAWSVTNSFIINKVGGACSLLDATPTAQLAPTATATPIPQTPIAAPAWLQANVNVNCRNGPGPEYLIIDTLNKSWSARIYGRNPESTWWYINTPNIAVHYYCWIWGGAVTITGDTSQVPIVEPPPPPTYTPAIPTETP
jgi:hypothetical protein